MHDLKILDDPTNLITAFRARIFDDADGLQRARETRGTARQAATELYAAQEKKNQLSREFGERKRAKLPTDDLTVALAEISQLIAEKERLVKICDIILRSYLSNLPNIPDKSVPDGDETNNKVITTDRAPNFKFKPLDHVELGTRMGLMSFEQGAAMSGSRFVVLSGALAKLERHLGQWMLDEAIAAGYGETTVPHLVREEAMFGTGQLPKFEEDLFKAGDHYLIPTAEVSLTNTVMDTILEQETEWATRLCALTPCYRAEAGSAGRDTRGLLRMHQFNKVELVTICDPSISDKEHERMLKTSCSVLSKLGLPMRVVLLSAGDMGFSAQKTYDIEVWLPSEKKFREIASISNCGDFQARRMNARWKNRGAKGTEFVHTLNGSAVAVGRAMLAIMENYQTENDEIVIPEVLRERMGGSIITASGNVA